MYITHQYINFISLGLITSIQIHKEQEESNKGERELLWPISFVNQALVTSVRTKGSRV